MDRLSASSADTWEASATSTVTSTCTWSCSAATGSTETGSAGTSAAMRARISAAWAGVVKLAQLPHGQGTSGSSGLLMINPLGLVSRLKKSEQALEAALEDQDLLLNRRKCCKTPKATVRAAARRPANGGNCRPGR